MYCTKCGNVLAEGASFCRACGQAVGSWTAAGLPETSVPSVATTPPPARFLYAGFWLRLIAYFIDSAILSIAFGAIVAVAIAFVGWDRIREARPGLLVQAARFDSSSVLAQTDLQYRGQFNFLAPVIFGTIVSVILAITIVTWLYYALMESSAKQGTVGKIIIGLFVTDLYGRRISFGRATGRFFAKFITGLIPLLIGYIMAGFTEKKQALHDILASCLVLRRV